MSKAGLTAAGKGLKKHANRVRSTFPMAVGNQTAINQQGENILKSILDNPSVTVTLTKSRSVREVLDYQIPGSIGVRFSKDGKTFIGFLEPN